MHKSTLVGGLAVALASMVLVLPPPGVVSAQTPGETYSDLWVVLRDVNGVPKTVEYAAETCVQPVSYEAIPNITPVVNDVDGRMVYKVPLEGEISIADPDVVCDPQAAFLTYASEVELERLNLVRTSDEVLWKKLVEVRTRLEAATAITLDGAGRIAVDGVSLDASPDYAAIYAAAVEKVAALEGGPGVTEQLGGLMDTGSIPGLAGYPATPASIDQNGKQFDEWMLAAAAVGTAAGKSVPITVDSIEYYNRTAAPDGLVANLSLIHI